MEELDFLFRVGGAAQGDGAGAVAGADEVRIGEGGAVDDFGVVCATDEAILAGKFVDELLGGGEGESD